MRVILSPRAEKQIEDLYHYIAAHSGEKRAKRFVERIVAFCAGLNTFPHRGTKRNDLMPGLRIIGFMRRVTIAFTVMEKFVLIEGIFYGGQNVSKAWLVE